MSYPMVHLKVAYGLLMRYDGGRMERPGDFMAGYCTHLLTDWENDRCIWTPFRERAMQGEAVDVSGYRFCTKEVMEEFVERCVERIQKHINPGN